MTPAKQDPGRLWYATQYARAFLTTPFRAATRPDVFAAGRNAAFALSLPIAAKFIVPYVILFPVLPTALWVAGVGGGLLFGLKAFHDIVDLKRSATVGDFVKKRREKWAPLGTRLRSLAARAGTGLGLGLVLAAAGTGLAAAGILQYTGVLTAAMATPFAVLAGIASLPVIIGTGVAAVAAGVATAVLCRKAPRNLAGATSAPEKKSIVARVLGGSGKVRSIEPVSKSFEKSVNTDDQRRIEAVKAARAARKAGGP